MVRVRIVSKTTSKLTQRYTVNDVLPPRYCELSVNSCIVRVFTGYWLSVRFDINLGNNQSDCYMPWPYTIYSFIKHFYNWKRLNRTKITHIFVVSFFSNNGLTFKVLKDAGKTPLVRDELIRRLKREASPSIQCFTTLIHLCDLKCSKLYTSIYCGEGEVIENIWGSSCIYIDSQHSITTNIWILLHVSSCKWGKEINLLIIWTGSEISTPILIM